MHDRPLEDLLDRLVAEFGDRLARGDAPPLADVLSQVPAEHRQALERCLIMMRAGIASSPASTSALLPGAQLDGFRILREIGRGGMAVVFLAEQEALRRRVALKVLRPGLALEARHVDRFQREALAIARLQHPHIVQVYAVGEARGHHYLAMEYVEGTNLGEVLERLGRTGVHPDRWTAADLARAAGIPALAREGATYEQALAHLLAPVARAIGVVHELGLVHRDIKPSNLLIHRDGRVLVADFGLAKGDGDPGLSLTGEPLGTPYYMSPEQAALTARPIDPRSDVYSLGVTLFEALAGRRPFEGESVLAVLDAIRTQAPPPLRTLARARTRDAEAVARRAMEREPEQRYAHALELATELSALAEGRPTQALVMEGGWVRRWRRTQRRIASGEITEYRSRRKFLGLPLVHVYFRRIPGQRWRIAKGWLAAGDLAIGGVAMGTCSIGLLGVGGFALGLLALGGIAGGVFSIGGFSAGFLPIGGFAAGYGAVGGFALGRYAIGGRVGGAHVIGEGARDPAAVEFFRGWVEWIRLMPGFSGIERFL